MADDSGRLMGSTEVAALLGVSPATIARAVQTGRLKTSEVTPGGHSRFSAGDVREFRTHGRRGQAGTARPGTAELPDLADRIDARVEARYGAGLSGGDWQTVLSRLDELADTVAKIVERPRLAVAPTEPTVETRATPERVTTASPPVTTIFEDGNSGITLVVRPIERFALIETITGLLAGVQGVGEIRLRRLQRGVAWFTIRYAGALPAATVFPRVLASLSAEVVATGERTFEATLPGAELAVPGAAGQAT